MSGGFFRGTSAEQDTRFSNKQAKLLKSQKFAPELDHLVAISKVKMDVIKPWIAKRVTELLGFEDEVLINFINGLLEGKDINGKQIQIQLTGFMEKHTGKFMKELWSLLLSAQNNASGVPQQFLDAKEEETRKKKEELDRIGSEMQKIREKGSQFSEQVHEKMDGGVIAHSTMEPSIYSDDEKEPGKRNGFRGRSRASRSPSLADRRPPHRERRSRNLSKSPPSRQHSISSERRFRSSQRSVSPMRRRSSDESLSPRRKSPKRRSTSRSRNRSFSPAGRRVRSPMHRRLPSPVRRRSRSRLQHRSRSPRRGRSPSPRRHQSPSTWRHRSRSPRLRRSPSPRRQRLSSPRRRSPSPRRRSPSPRRRRSPSPRRRRSPSPRRRRSPSPVRRHLRRSLSSSSSPVTRRPSSPSRKRTSPSKRRSPPLRRRSPSPSRNLNSPSKRRSSPPRRRSPLISKQRSPSLSKARSLSPVSVSPVKRRVPVLAHLRSPNKLYRSSSPHSQVSSSPARHISSSPSDGELPMLKKDLLQSPRGTPRSRDQCSPRFQPTQKDVNVIPPVAYKEPDTARRIISNSPRSKDHSPSEDREGKPYKYKSSQRSVRSPRQGSMGTPEKSSGEHYREDDSSRKENKDVRRMDILTKEDIALRNSTDDVSRPSAKPAVLKEGEESIKLMKKDDLNSPTIESSGSEGIDKHRAAGGKRRKHRKLSRQEIGCDSGDDSQVEDRKEAKRRKKEERKLRKEERKRRREERKWRKEEKRSHKGKRSKDRDSILSDSDNHVNGVNASAGKDSCSSDKQETESEKRKLENELREKALQNIRAKKGMGC